jgi:TRAP-type C4-dicarboxylate transport system substrate-binding protein
VYRADLPRTFALVAVLLLMAASTSAFAREFRAADTQNEDYPTPEVLVMPLKAWQSLSAGDQKIFREAAMATLYERAQRDPAPAALIDRIRRVE